MNTPVFSTYFSALDMVLEFSHSNRYAMALHSLNGLQCLACLHVLSGHLHSEYDKMFEQVFAHLQNCVICYC